MNFREFYQDKSVLRILNEGGQAAENLIPKLEEHNDKPLKYARATVNPKTLAEVDEIYTLLLSNGFIESKKPGYVLGSSRLFAIKAGLVNPKYDEIETKEIVQKALDTKSTFGDIDIDVHLKKGVSMAQIKNFLEGHDPAKYAGALTGGELNTAVVVNGTTDVIQIDIMDISTNPVYHQMSQFSSMADMAHGIKGAVRDLVVRAIAKTHPLPAEQQKAITNMLKNTDAYKKFFEKWHASNPDLKVRYSFAAEGLLLRVDWLVDGKSKAYSSKGIKFDKLKNFIDSSDPGIQPVTYGDDILTDILGVDSMNQLSHVTTMMPIIEKYPRARKQQIWNELIKGIKTKVPTATRSQGQMSLSEAQQAVEFMKPYFSNIDTSSSEEVV